MRRRPQDQLLAATEFRVSSEGDVGRWCKSVNSMSHLTNRWHPPDVHKLSRMENTLVRYMDLISFKTED